MKSKKKTILITGSTGFIAGRIIERLDQINGWRIKALAHNLTKAVRIARFDIEIIQGDILDKKLLKNITKNVDYVIHCAVGNTNSPKVNHDITVEGTRNIANYCLKNRVKRLIYFSTMSVYGYPLPDIVNERAPYKKISDDHYNNDKIQAEAIVLSKIKQGLAAVILQPTIVYGPYAGSWTIGPITELKSNQFFLVNNGQGLCNSLYIDNLVDGVILALTQKKAIGETFILTDGQPITWKKFYESYQKMIGNKKLEGMEKLDKYKFGFLGKPLKWLQNFNLPRPKFIIKMIKPLYLKTQAINNWPENRRKFFNDKCIFSINKARKLLNYSPRISFTQGMKLTKKWLEYSRFI